MTRRGIDATAPAGRRAGIGRFERYLTWWVAGCIVVGVALGSLPSRRRSAIGGLELARVNLPVAALIWLMIMPMLLKIDFGALGEVRRHARGIGVTLFINWAVKPFSMALLAWLFLRHVFAAWLPPDQVDSYVAGLILLAAAPCTAMVFVWSNLSDGDPAFTLSQVALNDTIMVFAFAPLVALLLGLASITVPWDTLALSVVLYIVVPVIFAQLWRRRLLATGGPARLAAVLARAASGVAGRAACDAGAAVRIPGRRQILAQPLIIAMLAVPILVQVYFNAGLAYWLSTAASASRTASPRRRR